MAWRALTSGLWPIAPIPESVRATATLGTDHPAYLRTSPHLPTASESQGSNTPSLEAVAPPTPCSANMTPPAPDLKPDEVRLVAMTRADVARIRHAFMVSKQTSNADADRLADAFESGLTEQDAIGLLANPPNPPVAAFKLRTAFKEQG